jgi:hypothetical protein
MPVRDHGMNFLAARALVPAEWLPCFAVGFALALIRVGGERFHYILAEVNRLRAALRFLDSRRMRSRSL